MADTVPFPGLIWVLGRHSGLTEGLLGEVPASRADEVGVW